MVWLIETFFGLLADLFIFLGLEKATQRLFRFAHKDRIEKGEIDEYGWPINKPAQDPGKQASEKSEKTEL